MVLETLPFELTCSYQAGFPSWESMSVLSIVQAAMGGNVNQTQWEWKLDSFIPNSQPSPDHYHMWKEIPTPSQDPGPRTQTLWFSICPTSDLTSRLALPPWLCSGNLRNPAGPRKWSHVCSYYQASSYSLNLEYSSPRYSTSIALSGGSLGSLHNCCLMGEAISSGHILGGIRSSPLLLYLLTFFLFL